jgi:NAD(P)-dependent dehydrogenase (short-subunit alcohol dehydrogenase family)
MISLEGKNILITGASSGIGKAAAIKSSSCGANIFISGRNFERLEITELLCPKGTVKQKFIGDLTDSNTIHTLCELLVKSNIHIDGLVHCAGIDLLKPFRMITHNDLNNIFNVNVFSSLLLTNAIIKNRNINKNASVVFLGSIMSYVGQKARVLYSSSKSALVGACKSLALEFANVPIRFNLVAPGVVQTEMITKLFESIPESAKENIIAKHPLGLGKPGDVANIIAFLISDEASWITGSEFIIDGGYSAQ